MEGTSSTPEGDGDMSALATAPSSSSVAPSLLPCSTSAEEIKESGEDNLNAQVLDNVVKTPSKVSSALTMRSPITTPSSSISKSIASPAKILRQLLPSPGKRYLQSQELEKVLEPQSETVEEMAEQILFGEIHHELPKVCKS